MARTREPRRRQFETVATLPALPASIPSAFAILQSTEIEEAIMYVVMGASGNTGHIVAESLIEAGKQVRAVGRSAEHLQRLVTKGAELCICDVADRLALAKAFSDAEGVYVMIPPNPTSRDYRASQDRITDSIAAALEASEVDYAVALSSFGADKKDKTGPVVGLHYLEQRLSQVASLNVLFLRPGYFMENTLAQIGIIKAMGTTAGPLRGDLDLPLIATQDIGEYAADALLSLEFTGQNTQELLGERDVTMIEAASIIGRSIDNPELSYLQLPPAEVRRAFTGMGMSENMADLMLEMCDALNSGHMAALEERTDSNTTPTSYETWV
ncbi:MAG TPA: NAD(P)H-binding protein, partial [Candidatus Acidoferrales bacterium]|nr:NAD(P)H-binding protein [Candidatus Acidoferrales bacterium]